MPYIISLDFVILHNCNFIPFDHLPTSPTSLPQATTILFWFYYAVLIWLLSITDKGNTGGYGIEEVV